MTNERSLELKRRESSMDFPALSPSSPSTPVRACRRGLLRSGRESTCSDDDMSRRHSLCSTDSLDSGIDMTPPPRKSLSSPLKSASRTRSDTTPATKKRISFHPNVVMWTAVQRGDFDELFDALAESYGVIAHAQRHASATRTCGVDASDLNRTNHQGITMLHLCCFAGSAKCVRLILALGASPHRHDDDGWTPLHAASVGCHDDIVRMLLAAGASPCAVDVFGRRPQDVAGSSRTKHILHTLDRRRRSQTATQPVLTSHSTTV